MRIAVMMRVIDQPTGLGTFVRRLVQTLLETDRESHYILIYRRPEWFGTFAEAPNATEVLVRRPSHKVLWDQIAVPYTAWRQRADVIFNPKFSIPLISSCPVTMGLQEPAWWAWPDQHPWWDVAYMRVALPLYVRKARHLFPMSRFILEENRKYLKLDLANATVTYTAPEPAFRTPLSPETLESVRRKHDLPIPFVFSSTRVENIGNTRTTFTDTKNVEATVRAWQIWRERIPHALVIAGKRVREFLLHRGWREADLSAIRFLDLVPREDMVALYRLASAVVMPSRYEGCPLTMLEAFSAGCPVVASSIPPFRELGTDAALYADPSSPDEFARQVCSLVTDPAVAEGLRSAALERVGSFDWNRVAQAVLRGLRQAAGH